MQKLLHYLGDNNPDLLLQLEEEGRVTAYLTDKIEGIEPLLNSSRQPLYILEQTCLDVLTVDLLPSRYNFLCGVLEEEFEQQYNQLQFLGVVKFEALNMLACCGPLFDAMHFGAAAENNRLLHYAVAGAIADYFEKQQREKETVGHGLQQPA